MTQLASGTPAAAQDRHRPTLHFTVRRGWVNDPYGVVYSDGRYHMFFQYNPDGTTWSPRCHWGHAISADLVHWTEMAVALTPDESEIGCWSGSTVVAADGQPTILYTRIANADWGLGQVALARGSADLTTWQRDPLTSVITGPPPDLGGTAFRDPYVWHTGTHWTMVMGIGLPGGVGAAVQYRSDDLVEWSYTGIIAQRSTNDTDDVWTGTLWECPQLIEVGATWVLLVSVWDDDVLHYVAYALGDYDGCEFTARTWGRFTHGDQLYAMSAFRDTDGRPCVMSWFRERDSITPPDSPFAGAISLTRTLAVRGDNLIAELHPFGDSGWSWRLEDTSPDLAASPLTATVSTAPTQIRLIYATGGAGLVVLTRTGTDGSQTLRLSLDVAARALTVEGAAGDFLLRAPLDPTRPEGTITVVLDADLLELTSTGVSGMATARIPHGAGTIRLSGVGLHIHAVLGIADVTRISGLHRDPADVAAEKVPVPPIRGDDHP